MPGIKAPALILLALLPFGRAFGVDRDGPNPGVGTAPSQAEARAKTSSIPHLGVIARLVDALGHYPVAFTKVSARLQPIARHGAELDRVDRGHPIDAVGAFPPDTSPYGTVAYGVLDLPLQPRGLDVYAIAGILPPKGILNALVSAPSVSACPG